MQIRRLPRRSGDTVVSVWPPRVLSASGHSLHVLEHALTGPRESVPHFRPYDLRHTFARLLLAAHAPITYVSSQLGHANPTTTLRYYARWIPTKGQRWVDVLDGDGSAASRALRATAEGSGSRFWNQKLEPWRSVGEGGRLNA